MAKNPHLKMENRITVIREYADLWANFFKYLTEDLRKREITEDMERDFENLQTILSVNHYKFTELCGEFLKDADGVMGMITEAYSLQAIKEAQEATLGKWQVETHTLLIDMHKALGRMLAKLTPKQLEEYQASMMAHQEGA